MKTNEKTQQENEEKVYSIANSKDSLLRYYEGLGDGTKKLRGFKTGIGPIDEAISGVDKFVLLAGRSGSGKTALAIQMALGVIKHNKIPTLFYSLEMTKAEVYTRMVQVCAHMDGYKKTLTHNDIDLNGNSTKLSQDKYDALEDAKKSLWNMADYLYIHDAGDKMPGVLGPRDDSKPNLDSGGTARDKDLWSRNFIKQKVGEIQEMHYGKRPDPDDEDEKAACPVLVVIDSFQDIVYGSKTTTDAEKETAEALSTLIDETGCTILAISQKNKNSGGSDGYSGVLGSVSLIHKPNVVVTLTSAKEMTMTSYGRPAGTGKKTRKDEEEKKIDWDKIDKEYSQESTQEEDNSFESTYKVNMAELYSELKEQIKKTGQPSPVYFDMVKSRFTPTVRVKLALYGSYGYFECPTEKDLRDNPDYQIKGKHAGNGDKSVAKFYANYDWYTL